MNTLLKLVDALEYHIPKYEVSKSAISAEGIGWHIEHSLLTIFGIIHNLKKSDPNSYIWKFIPIKYIVFTLKKIPRGIAKAPVHVTPKNRITSEHLIKHIHLVKEKIKTIDGIDNRQFFMHPFFGNLQKK